MRFTKPKDPSFEWNTGIKGWIYNSSKDFPNASGVYFEVTGRHGTVKTTSSDRVYFVIEGEGEFIIDGKSVPVSTHDMVIVPKNTPYDYAATGEILKLFLVHTPAYNREGEIKLE